MTLFPDDIDHLPGRALPMCSLDCDRGRRGGGWSQMNYYCDYCSLASRCNHLKSWDLFCFSTIVLIIAPSFPFPAFRIWTFSLSVFLPFCHCIGSFKIEDNPVWPRSFTLLNPLPQPQPPTSHLPIHLPFSLVLSSVTAYFLKTDDTHYPQVPECDIRENVDTNEYPNIFISIRLL